MNLSVPVSICPDPFPIPLPPKVIESKNVQGYRKVSNVGGLNFSHGIIIGSLKKSTKIQETFTFSVKFRCGAIVSPPQPPSSSGPDVAKQSGQGRLRPFANTC